jgi:hypothetical protein
VSDDDVSNYLAELEARLLAFFEDQADGLDIPPAVLYRLEGFIEAGVIAKFINAAEIKSRLCELAQRYANTEVAALYRSDERLILHLHMPEAPVYPSKKS